MELIDHERSESGIFEGLFKESCLAIDDDSFCSGIHGRSAHANVKRSETDRTGTSRAIVASDSTVADFAFRHETTIRSSPHQPQPTYSATSALACRTTGSYTALTSARQSKAGSVVASRR